MLPLAGLLLTPIDLRQKAIDATLHALSQHQLVGFSEVHQSEECHAFLRDLIRSPKFSTRTIIVEFGNSRFQSTLDAYIAGKPIRRQELQKIWRNTTQFLVWDSPVYEKFFRTVREVNRHRKSSQKIRVLAGDPPVDWPNVHTAHDFDQYAKRDTFYFSLADRIYRRKESALLIYGGMHLFKRDLFDGSNGQSTVEPLPELRARYGKDFYVIWTQFGKIDSFSLWFIPSTSNSGKPLSARRVRASCFRRTSSSSAA